MYLYWHGGRSVTIDDGEHTVKVTPLDLEKELKPARSQGGSGAAAVVLLQPKSEIKIPPKTTSFVINNPGEYDVKGFFIWGLGGFSGNLVYVIETMGVRLCHLDGVGRELTGAELEGLSDIDVLLVDVGEDDDANEIASKMVGQIEPKVVVPVGYGPEKRPAVFLKELGASEVETQNRLVLKKKDLPQEEMRVVMLNAVR